MSFCKQRSFPLIKIFQNPRCSCFFCAKQAQPGRQLPEELPGNLLHASLIWVHRNGIISSIPAVAIRWSLCLHAWRPLLLHHLNRGGTKSSPSAAQALHGRRCKTRQSVTLRLTAWCQHGGQAGHCLLRWSPTPRRVSFSDTLVSTYTIMPGA
jgi:hypothetical protein